LEAYAVAENDGSAHVDIRAEAIYRRGLRLRRDRQYAAAADCWRRLLELKQGRLGRRSTLLAPLQQYAVEALAIHHEHRERDYEGARDLTVRLLDELEESDLRRKAEVTRHRMTRLDRKLARVRDSQLFGQG